MKELGEYLKETRIENGVGIEEASEDLEISTSVLKNMESGNTRAFKDMLELKEYVKKYAKYLGLDPEKVVDEFNDFLFEHTSKISLSDILEAEKTSNKKEEKVVSSPYTKVRKKRIQIKNYKIIYGVIIGILFLIILVLVLRGIFIPKNNIINRELKSFYYVGGGIY